MGYALSKECEKVGIDERAVVRIANRLDKVMHDADKLGLSLFCGGSSPSLRFNDGDASDRLLIVGFCMFNNADGGDGGVSEDEHGYLRGE